MVEQPVNVVLDLGHLISIQRLQLRLQVLQVCLGNEEEGNVDLNYFKSAGGWNEAHIRHSAAQCAYTGTEKQLALSLGHKSLSTTPTEAIINKIWNTSPS